MPTTTAPSTAVGASPDHQQITLTSADSQPGRGFIPRPDNHVIVLFGAAGDLARRKLLFQFTGIAEATIQHDGWAWLRAFSRGDGDFGRCKSAG